MDNQEEPQRNRHLIFIIVTYLLLTISTHFSAQVSSFNEHPLKYLNDSNPQNIQIPTMFTIFNSENYEGQWKSENLLEKSMLTLDEGKFSMSIHRDSLQKSTYGVQLRINNGIYIDQGCLIFKFNVNGVGWQTENNGTFIQIKPKKNTTVEASYKFDKILHTEDEKLLQIPQTKFLFSRDQKTGKPVIRIELKDKNRQYISTSMVLVGRQSKLLKSITFAILLFFISYMQFSAIMEILRGIIEGNQTPTQYSFLALMITTMWDAVLCIVAFVCAFDNEQNLIMFIMPAFLLCLLFTNLQLRLMLMIYQVNSQANSMREIICKFNLISYGALMLIYPILLFANFNILFFIGICLIFLPQIYLNGINGVRPQISSPYYSKFLLVRFLIIFYLRCFPWNIFQLEPNYHLGFFCMLLIGLQVFVLWYQKIYGPKRVLPKFLLPTVFNYKYQQSYTVQQSVQMAQCSICLNPLHMEPANENDLGYDVDFQLMRTPCSHKYHGLCLIKWMKVKMECPQCRTKLPPYQ